MLTASAISLSAQRTTRKNLRPLPAAAQTENTGFDTIVNINPDDILLTGYDKPLRSNKETIFVTNHTDRRILSITLRIDYSDMKGRQLHSRETTVNCDIPPHQTRQLTFRSWDAQQSFVYHRSQRPRRADFSPYDIRTAICRYVAANDNQ